MASAIESLAPIEMYASTNVAGTDYIAAFDPLFDPRYVRHWTNGISGDSFHPTNGSLEIPKFTHRFGKSQSVSKEYPLPNITCPKCP